jgi:hypothetical protein
MIPFCATPSFSRFVWTVRSLIFCVIVFGACSSDPDSDPEPPNPPPTDVDPDPLPEEEPPVRVKKNTLVSISHSDLSYPSLTLAYDDIGHLKNIKTENLFPGDYQVHWKNDTIDYVFNSSTVGGKIDALSNVFVYNASGQCYKILTKKRNNADHGTAGVSPTNPFFSDQSGVPDSYDSLVYSPSGQLTEVWTGDPYSVSKNFSFTYANEQAAAPLKIQLYGPGWMDEIELATNDMDQPIFNALWFLPFIKPAGSLQLYTAVTPQSAPGFFYIYMPLVKKCVTEWTFTSYSVGGGTEQGNHSIYYYKADSTEFIGRRDPDDISFARFKYRFEKL